MPRHKTEPLYESQELEVHETKVASQSSELSMLLAENNQLRDLLIWISDHIHVRNANGQRTKAKCALCPFTYRKDSRGRSIKEPCRHDEIWRLTE